MTLIYIEPYIISLVYYCYVFLGCELLRRIGVQAFRFSINGRLVVNEFLGTLQLCLCVFETSLIDKYYGIKVYFACLTLIVWLHISTKRTAYANPSPILENWLLDSLSTKLFLYLLVAEVAAAHLAYMGAKQFWKIGFTPDHVLKLNTTFCHTDLKVPLAMGLAYETLGTFVDRMVWQKAERILPARIADLVGCIGVATITVVGFEYTGMYFNPILASAATYGCIGLDSLEHTVVYWLGPLVGWMIGTRINTATTRSAVSKQKKA